MSPNSLDSLQQNTLLLSFLVKLNSLTTQPTKHLFQWIWKKRKLITLQKPTQQTETYNSSLQKIEMPIISVNPILHGLFNHCILHFTQPFYPTPEPKVAKTSNLACSLVFTKLFPKNWFWVDDVTIVMSK